MTSACRVRQRLRNLVPARKINIVIIALLKGVSSVALLLAGAALIGGDTSAARASLTRDIGMLAAVVGAPSTASRLERLIPVPTLQPRRRHQPGSHDQWPGRHRGDAAASHGQ
jgi:hypothetical protein